MKENRGMVTDQIKEKSKELLGYEIGVRELRLMPYLQFTMVNSQKIDPRRINEEEREILSKWRQAGYIEGGLTPMSITKEFWNIINELIYLGYVD